MYVNGLTCVNGECRLAIKQDEGLYFAITKNPLVCGHHFHQKELYFSIKQREMSTLPTETWCCDVSVYLWKITWIAMGNTR